MLYSKIICQRYVLLGPEEDMYTRFKENWKDQEKGADQEEGKGHEEGTLSQK